MKKKIHFVGIKGVGMAPLAVMAKEAGKEVSGCDIGEGFITDEILQNAGITPLVGFDAKHVEAADIIITTGAHGGFDNPEVKRALDLGKTVITQGEAVGKVMDGTLLGKPLAGISVAGSHGKTTTTAMIATMFKSNKLDPSFLIGTGSIVSLGGSGHYGKGKYFVAEADEYATEPTHNKTPKFLWQKPKIGVITNIELDHTDLYPTIDAISSAFLQFAQNVDASGVLIVCGDDPEVKKLLGQYKKRVITYGMSPVNDFVLKRVTVGAWQTFFWVETKDGTSLGEFVLSVAGVHNALNALAALIVGMECNLSMEQIKQGLLAFTGTKRRAEFKGKFPSGALFFDDYAHHPTEIKKTLEAFRESYKKSNIICIFQPHTYSRTKALFDDFCTAFAACDAVIITDIYASLREAKDPSITSEMLVQKISSKKQALYLPTPADVVEYVKQSNYPRNTIIITMGAGDIYKISEQLEVKK